MCFFPPSFMRIRAGHASDALSNCISASDAYFLYLNIVLAGILSLFLKIIPSAHYMANPVLLWFYVTKLSAFIVLNMDKKFSDFLGRKH